MRVGDKVAEWLESKGIDQAFGIIGGGNISVFDAIHKRGFTHVCAVHHEQAAAMASTYFNRIKGALQSVVLVTTGAGSSNALTGVMAAWMDRIPLLIISGNEASEALKGRTRILGVQGFRSDEVAHHMCVGTCQLTANNILDELNGIYDLASICQGPVWIDIPKNVATTNV